MKERPIVLSGRWLRAALDGKKSQTRRVVKPPPSAWIREFGFSALTPDGCISGRGTHPYFGPAECKWRSPFGLPGDRLWVRENYCEKGDDNGCVVVGEYHYKINGVYVAAVDDDGHQQYRKDGKEASPWRTSRFMPRVASRLTLDVTSVRVERLQAITEIDVAAEGIRSVANDGPWRSVGFESMRASQFHSPAPDFLCSCLAMHPALEDAYPERLPPALCAWREAWDEMHFANGDGWEMNPWVWVIGFEKSAAKS
jgi:hypothetical protein